ncbi:putative 39S ribosomal protein L23, mitochondrial-like [Apostichopus japonicus]|uniref:Large ribosomal subunit protein uL23m n=1 Tax=Stichopus japonicus TaxID=307972 RepID=A0A2G8K961_STIJA|nr:putative 39S ribosomal protein L23, mitochondrial-like [Apostichopus japonicus]
MNGKVNKSACVCIGVIYDFKNSDRYARFLPGGPQRRVFFPDFYLKMVKPQREHPPNVVVFHCPVQMTKFDVKNYLEKIYNVPVERVNTSIPFNPIVRDHQNRRWMPRDEFKVAFVTLADGQTFKFPELFAPPASEDDDEVIDSLKEKEKKETQALASRGGLPSWFGI